MVPLGAATLQKGHFIEEQIAFHAREIFKKGFLGFSDIAPLKPLVYLLQCLDNAQTYKIPGSFNLEGGKI